MTELLEEEPPRDEEHMASSLPREAGEGPSLASSLPREAGEGPSLASSLPHEAGEGRGGGSTKKRRRKLTTKLAAFGLSVALSLVAVEVGARIATRDPVDILYDHYGQLFPGKPLGKTAFFESLFFPSRKHAPAHFYQLDPKLGFTLLAKNKEEQPFAEAPSGHYLLETNELGLRDVRQLVPKKPGALRVLVVGDSMTFGLGVEREQAFPAQLEKRLAAALAPREVEVVNAGVPCWGQREELAFLEHRARALEPDVVVLEFTVANDVLDDLRYAQTPEGDLVPDDGPEGLGSDLEQHFLFQNFLAENSRAYRLLIWHVGRHIIRYRAMQEPMRLNKASDLITRARDTAQGLGARFVLLIAPTKVQVDKSLVGRLIQTEKVNKAIIARAQKDGIEVIDPLSRLRKAVKTTGKKLYFPKDQHWDPDGHEVIADVLAETLGRK